MNLEQHADWYYLLEMQCVYDDSGKEEVYIVNYGTALAPPPIPEPLTVFGVLAGLGGMAGYLRRRRMA